MHEMKNKIHLPSGYGDTHLHLHLLLRLKQEDWKFEASLEHVVRLSQNKGEKEKARPTRCSRKLISHNFFILFFITTQSEAE